MSRNSPVMLALTVLSFSDLTPNNRLPNFKQKKLRELLSFFCLFVVSCVSVNPNPKPITETVFRGSMDQVWMATEKALSKYPISESNRDSGILRTDFLRGPQCWHSPTSTEKFSAGVRCNLTLQIIKIPHNGIRVKVNKALQMVRDFVSEPEDLASDGMEEIHILYRIDRELSVAKDLSLNH